MRVNFIFSCFLLGALFTSSCTKTSNTAAGKVSISIKVRHHQVPIAFSKVFVKYNTLQFPGKEENLYDASYTTDQSGNMLLSDIGNGKKEFIFYAKGIDPNWDSTGTTPVWGFQPILVNTQPGQDKEVAVTIPVSE